MSAKRGKKTGNRKAVTPYILLGARPSSKLKLADHLLSGTSTGRRRTVKVAGPSRRPIPGRLSGVILSGAGLALMGIGVFRESWLIVLPGALVLGYGLVRVLFGRAKSGTRA